MKPFGSLKLWIPLVGLGAVLALAPQSRAQADVSPDHFDENGIQDVALAKAKAAKPTAVASQTQTTAGTSTAHNKKPATKAGQQVATTKKPTDATEPKLVAVQDRKKVPATTTSKQ